MVSKIAIFYQASEPPAIAGLKKPLKLGGYRDSGADIGFALVSRRYALVTPKLNPEPTRPDDWVFPDTAKGFEDAFGLGARVFWLNTVLYRGHPVEVWLKRDVEFIGQSTSDAEDGDNKFLTNKRLREAGLAVAHSNLLSECQYGQISFPVVLKPIRGRGSQGVVVVNSDFDLKTQLNLHIKSSLYGADFILEEFLPGKELTITVMPPGNFNIDGGSIKKASHWALPGVFRFNHIDGIAPYNGVVAVVNNSRVLTAAELAEGAYARAQLQCTLAAKIVNAKAPIRIDCRQSADGEFKIFDLNMKPNMTGAGRPDRSDQDSLSAIAARAIGWDYGDLIAAMVSCRWRQ
ncbi:ATP-grasp domain-containing protein [Bdellovibrio bacteriovorus]|uniref:ATP-grasp domain-containing protein n=1 Tax=Bdellovibrio bacteriovorus TaxID=959 RepID=UPI003A80CAA5